MRKACLSGLTQSSDHLNFLSSKTEMCNGLQASGEASKGDQHHGWIRRAPSSVVSLCGALCTHCQVKSPLLASIKQVLKSY